MDRLHRAYRRAESQLISTLENLKGEVKYDKGHVKVKQSL